MLIPSGSITRSRIFRAAFSPGESMKDSFSSPEISSAPWGTISAIVSTAFLLPRFSSSKDIITSSPAFTLLGLMLLLASIKGPVTSITGLLEWMV